MKIKEMPKNKHLMETAEHHAKHTSDVSRLENTIQKKNAWRPIKSNTTHPTLTDDTDETNYQNFHTTKATTPPRQEQRKHTDTPVIKNLNQTPEHSTQPPVKNDSQLQREKRTVQSCFKLIRFIQK